LKATINGGLGPQAPAGPGQSPGLWLILGASSAIARAFARQAAASGSDIILAGRDQTDLAHTAADLRIASGRTISIAPFDALDRATHAALAEHLAVLPGIVNIAVFFGIMPEQATMDADAGQALACIDTGFAGAVAVLQTLAPELEKRRGGVIVGVGSVAGDRGRLKNYIYGATKAGLHTYLAGLRNRLGRSGGHVVTVKPGFVDTAMTFGLPGMFLVASPDAVARACLKAAAKRRDVIYVPGFWWPIMAVIKAIPEGVFKRLSL
jgi:short-subunit dehydrogenase